MLRHGAGIEKVIYSPKTHRITTSPYLPYYLLVGHLKLMDKFKVKLQLFLVALLTPYIASAVLGPDFDRHEIPHSVCAIEFFSEYTPQMADEICSAVVVSDRTLLTAAHCAVHLPNRRHRILCRDSFTTQVESSVMQSQLNLEQLRVNESEHRLDSAFIQVQDQIQVPAMKVISVSKQDVKAAISKSDTCGIFGHGGFRENLRSQGLATNAQIHPEQIVFRGDLIIIDGFTNRASGLVEPGDSGGSLACRNKESQEWYHLAQVSGRTMQGISLFAPTYLLHKDLEQANIIDEITLSQQVEFHHQRWLKSDLQHSIDICSRNYRRFTGSDFVPTQEGRKAQLNECRNAKVEELDMKVSTLAEGESIRVSVKKYSSVYLDQSEGMIQLRLNRNPQRFYKQENPFTTADQEHSHFHITKKDGEFFIGRLIQFGYSEYFGCRANILCDAGEFKNVKIHRNSIRF